MELGLTFPLQRFLKRPVPYGTETDPLVCWDLHIITLRGRRCLLGVHCPSRYAFVLFDLTGEDWRQLETVFLQGAHASLAAAGFSQKERQRLLPPGESPLFTRTHGRREVAFLNRAWEAALGMDYALDPSRREQPLLDLGINSLPTRCAAFSRQAGAAEQLRRCLAHPQGLPPLSQGRRGAFTE